MKMQSRSRASRKHLKQQRADVRTALQSLIDAGLVVPTGEMRPEQRRTGTSLRCGRIHRTALGFAEN